MKTEILDLLTHLEWLINAPIQQDKTPVTKAAGRRLEHLDKKVTSINEAVSKLTSNDDVYLIRLYDEQLDTFKVELDDIYRTVLNSDEPEDEELSILRIILEALPLKTGDGKELRRLHDTVLQHIRAL